MRSLTIAFVSVCQFNEFAGGIDRVCIQLMRKFHSDGYKVINLYCKPSIMGVARGINEKSQYILPNVDVPNSKDNIAFCERLFIEEQVSIVLDESFMMGFHDMLVELKLRTPFKLVSHYHGDPFNVIKDLKDNIGTINIQYLSKKDKFLLFLYNVLKYPLSCCVRMRNQVRRFRKISSESDAYVFLSETYAEDVRKICKENRTKIFSITNPIYLPEYISQFHKSNQVLFVGRLVFQKRVDRLLDAWKYVEQEDKSIMLYVVGDGEARDSYESYSRKLGLRNVVFKGAQSSFEFIKDAKVLCLVSSHEGLPMVILEAMAMGTVPIVYDSYSSISDLIKNNFNGRIIKPYYRKAFASAIIDVCVNDQYRKKLSINAQRSIAKNSIEEVSAQWYRLFDYLLTL